LSSVEFSWVELCRYKHPLTQRNVQHARVFRSTKTSRKKSATVTQLLAASN